MAIESVNLPEYSICLCAGSIGPLYENGWMNLACVQGDEIASGLLIEEPSLNEATQRICESLIPIINAGGYLQNPIPIHVDVNRDVMDYMIFGQLNHPVADVYLVIQYSHLTEQTRILAYGKSTQSNRGTVCTFGMENINPLDSISAESINRQIPALLNEYLSQPDRKPLPPKVEDALRNNTCLFHLQ